MSNTWYFLADLNETLDLWQQAEDRIIEYAGRHHEDRHSWSIMNVVTDRNEWLLSDGSVVHLPDGWHHAWIEAMLTVALEFQWHLPDNCSRATILTRMKSDAGWQRQELCDVVCSEAPAYLAWSFDRPNASRPGSDDWTHRYRRSRIAKIYERFMALKQPDRYPFTEDMGSPDEYRAFDLTHSDQVNAIIRVRVQLE